VSARSSLAGGVIIAVCLAGCSFSVDGWKAGADLAPPTPPIDPPDLAQPPMMPPDLLPPPPPDLQVVYAGSLVLTATNLVTAQEILLSTLGTRDWVHWGYTTAADVDRKMTGAAQIGNFTVIGPNAPTLYTDNIVGFNWTDGMPHMTSGGAQTSGLYVTALNNGFHLTIPAVATRRTLYLYVGGYHSTGRLSASLSDASAPAISFDKIGNASGKYAIQLELDFAAASAAQTLDITWVDESGDSSANVTLQAAALADFTQ
jgi:hypothetical protein